MNTQNSLLKRIEVGSRRLFNKWFLKDRSPVRVLSLDDALTLDTAPRILFLRQDRIGDVIVTTPLLKAVRDRFPNAHLGMLLSKNNVAVKQAVAPYVNEILVYQKTFSSLISVIRKVRAGKYDVVIDLLDNASSTSSVFVTYSGSRYAIGVEKENSGVYTHVVPLKPRSDVHIVERIAELLMPLGINPTLIDLRPLYNFSVEELSAARASIGIDGQEAALGVILSGSMASKRYGTEKTIAVLKIIMKSRPDVKPFIFGAPGEEEDVREVAVATGAQEVEASTSFHAFAALLHEMSALWTPDTSTVHLAAAWNIPCCIMFNRDTEDRLPWFPYNTFYEAVFSETGSIADIPVDEVVGSVENLLTHCKIK